MGTATKQQACSRMLLLVLLMKCTANNMKNSCAANTRLTKLDLTRVVLIMERCAWFPSRNAAGMKASWEVG